jgi:hypothetical protein
MEKGRGGAPELPMAEKHSAHKEKKQPTLLCCTPQGPCLLQRASMAHLRRSPEAFHDLAPPTHHLSSARCRSKPLATLPEAASSEGARSLMHRGGHYKVIPPCRGPLERPLPPRGGTPQKSSEAQGKRAA